MHSADGSTWTSPVLTALLAVSLGVPAGYYTTTPFRASIASDKVRALSRLLHLLSYTPQLVLHLLHCMVRNSSLVVPNVCSHPLRGHDHGSHTKHCFQIELLSSQGITFTVGVELMVPSVRAGKCSHVGAQVQLESATSDEHTTRPSAVRIRVVRTTVHGDAVTAAAERGDITRCRSSLSRADCGPVLDAAAADHIGLSAEASSQQQLIVLVVATSAVKDGEGKGNAVAFASETKTIILLFDGWDDTSCLFTRPGVQLVRSMCFADTADEKVLTYNRESHSRDSAVTQSQPQYHLLFTLLNDDPVNTDMEWDANGAVEVSEPTCVR